MVQIELKVLLVMRSKAGMLTNINIFPPSLGRKGNHWELDCSPMNTGVGEDAAAEATKTAQTDQLAPAMDGFARYRRAFCILLFRFLLSIY